MRVTVAPSPSASRKNSASVSAETLLKAQLRTGMSNKGRKTLAAALNSSSEGRIVERGYQKKLLEMSKKTRDFFVASQIDVKGKKYTVAHCTDLEEFIEFAYEERDKTIMNGVIKIGIDAGQNFLKVCMSIMSDRLEEDDDEELKDGGVLKLFVVAIAEDLAESYQAISELLRLIQAEKVGFFLACDMKVANIYAGIQNHASSFPCPWCLAPKSKLNEEAEDRTYGNISAENKKYKENGGLLKDFYNCVEKPLLFDEDNDDSGTKILEKIPPPQLHLLLGITNLLFKAVQRKSSRVAKKWMSEVDVVQNAYHGGDFTGNACRKLLRGADKLERVVTEDEKSHDPDLHQLIKCIRAFNQVVTSSFCVLRGDNYVQAIEDFKEAFLELDGISVTPKVHAVFFHVVPFLQNKEFEEHKLGLGYYSEQAMETAHSLFKVHWRRYKRPKESSAYAKNLLQCVNDFNYKHV